MTVSRARLSSVRPLSPIRATKGAAVLGRGADCAAQAVTPTIPTTSAFVAIAEQRLPIAAQSAVRTIHSIKDSVVIAVRSYLRRPRLRKFEDRRLVIEP
jgi:hypothetical protein